MRNDAFRLHRSLSFFSILPLRSCAERGRVWLEWLARFDTMSELQRAASDAPTAENFVRDVLAAVELAFSEFFGARWSPEINELYAEVTRTCVAQARLVDSGLPESAALLPVEHSRILTNYRDKVR